MMYHAIKIANNVGPNTCDMRFALNHSLLAASHNLYINATIR